MGKVKNGTAKNRGIDWGNRVANAVIACALTDDIRVTTPDYVPGQPGARRVYIN